VLGYATVVPSSTHVLERWHNLPSVHELGAVEVVRTERRRRLASTMLQELTRAMQVETMILFARGFVSHWDLAETGLPGGWYRQMLVAMVSRVGLVHEDTDDPEVADHPLNFFAARYGRDVDSSSLTAFRTSMRASQRDT
jgi:acetoin utilization protein AcuA